MLDFVAPSVRILDASAPGGPAAILWYARRLYQFRKIARSAILHQGFAFTFRCQPPPPHLATPRGMALRHLNPVYQTPQNVRLTLERALVRNV